MNGMMILKTGMVDLEDKFIDLAFGMVRVADLDASDVKQYIRYIADRIS